MLATLPHLTPEQRRRLLLYLSIAGEAVQHAQALLNGGESLLFESVSAACEEVESYGRKALEMVGEAEREAVRNTPLP